jgi:hypothetical protein
MKKAVVKLGLVLAIFTITQNVIGQSCNIEITSPRNGSGVISNGLVSGTVNLPINGHLWILSHKVGFTGWWPQGNGEAQVLGNAWDVLVYYGVKDDFGQFETIAIIVDEQTHRNLETWVKTAPEKNYPPIALPTTIDGCALARVRVEKSSN